MAKPTPQINQELTSNLVQEIAKSCKEVPQKFLHKDGFPKAIDDPNIWENHRLLIDYTVLTSTTRDALDELAKMRSALSNWGCFQLISPTVTNSECSRISVAAFWYPEDGDEIGPVSELIGGDCPQKYRTFDMKEFKKVFFETYAQGLTPLDALKL